MKVEWSTAWERSNNHFVIERSNDAKNFQEIGYVDAKGDTDLKSNYVYYDSKPLSGISYYRLLQVDNQENNNGNATEGKKTYSRIVAVNNPNINLVVVAPNPSVSQFKIQLDKSLELKSWNLSSIQGRILIPESKADILDLTHYPAGEYILNITSTDGKVYYKKVVKQ
ncbi:T9SS type A sorting domain-containing protein [Dyadobacter sp. NIV53]|uniref:T9SS type A sorting domain-containing protein n=1 Tax=Dyadobacter sp. NIV53 TaxID=2861765 RepID=UPI001E3D2CDC|nr:T9SS type A sorting domain-containing protein [Dyadobacter sp. NIV53]